MIMISISISISIMDGSCTKKKRKKKRKQGQKEEKKAMSSYELDDLDGRGQRTMTRLEQTIGVRARRSGVHTGAEIRDDGPRDQGAAERTEGALIRRVEAHGMAGESGWGWGAWCVLGCWDGRWLALCMGCITRKGEVRGEMGR
jgi:hypothetical protein